MKQKKSTPIQASLDRIEGDIAVIYLGEEEETKVDIPVRYLPPGIKAGSLLKITIEEDTQGKQELKSKISNLQQELLNKNKS